MCVLQTCFLDTSLCCGNNQSTWSWFQLRGFTTVHKALPTNPVMTNQRLWSHFKYWNNLRCPSWWCIFLSFHSSWGIRYKTYLPGCAWQWPYLAFCFQERLSSLAWEESRDEGTSFRPLFPLPPTGDKGTQTLRDGTVRWNTGLDFVF